MRLLDCGCGWGGLMKFATANYAVSCVGLTISEEQAAYCKQHAEHLPIERRLCDYRAFNTDALEKFDRVTVVGMIEHVGSKNHTALFDAARRSMTDDGLFMLQTIGKTSAIRYSTAGPSVTFSTTANCRRSANSLTASKGASSSRTSTILARTMTRH
jgi:cyclopropane fatty-acyl-phospholipid synthase-like methyltransferase